MTRHKVIAISGISGAGKTTLARALARHLRAQLVAYDAFETMTRRPPADIRAWIERGCPYEDIPCPGLSDALDSARAKGPVVLDTPLGRAQPLVAGRIDHAVWLDCPAEEALARKLHQMRHPEKGPPAPEDWITGYRALYHQIVLPAQKIQMSRVPPCSDQRLISDGRFTTARHVSDIVLVLNRQTSRNF